MNWLFRLFFPNTNTTVRIRRDHLPGLKAPTAAAPIPVRPDLGLEQTENIQEIYKRYKATNPKPTKKRTADDGWLGLL